MLNLTPVLEGNAARRTLSFFWLVDYSGSMSGTKIAILNQAIREAIPEIQNSLSTHPEVQIMMRAIKFASGADWHVGPEAVPIEQFVWPELSAEGPTATAQAINMLCDELENEKMRKREYPPVCILISDGYCTDPVEDYEGAIKRLDSLPWGRKAVRLAIAIDKENDYDEAALLKFISHKEIGVLKADSPGRLAQYIKWSSVSASVGSAQSNSSSSSELSNVNLTPPPSKAAITDSTDVF